MLKFFRKRSGAALIAPPTAAQLTKANMAAVPNPYLNVQASGDQVRSWNGKNFVVVTGNVPLTEQLYAVPSSWVNPNELSPNQASLETGKTTGWTPDV